MNTTKTAILAMLAATLSFLAVGCEEGFVFESMFSNQEAKNHIEQFGLTCEAQNYVRSLSDVKREKLVTSVTVGMGESDIRSLVNNREMNCAADGNSGIGVIHQALWAGEVIEENDDGSNQTAPYLVGQDNQGAQVCGTDGNDFIGFYNKSGAYSDPSSLRLDGDSSGARCMIGNNAARVYDNDIVVVCYGYWTVVFCPGDEDEICNAEIWIQ
ncbi:hypothetical protein JW899_04630 [Candidatus Uhrbacteria bacterium]|nr:hypothetical protein [Candidatus Uhrbacteria bacterium]